MIHLQDAELSRRAERVRRERPGIRERASRAARPRRGFAGLHLRPARFA
jgi:hypothetical protein